MEISGDRVDAWSARLPLQAWRRSSLSLDTGNCVEMRLTDSAVEVRDSKDRGGPVLRVSIAQWSGLIDAINRGTL
jgi:hypothetical protein